MSRKRLMDESISWEEAVKRMEMKYASLKENYKVVQRRYRALKQKSGRSNDKKKWLQVQIRFLQRKYQIFTEKDHEKHAADKPARHELTGLQPLMSTTHHTYPEMVVTHALEQANKKRDLENNGLVSAQKPSKVKDGRKKKIKADLLVSPEYGDKSITISKIPNEPAEALAIEDKSGRHELTGMQTFSSTYDRPLPDMTAVTNKKRRLENNALTRVHKPSNVKDGRNRKIKADPLVSPEFVARNISISGRPNEPTEALTIQGETSRYELIGMQPLLPTDDCITIPQPSDVGILTALPMPHRSLATPNVEDMGILTALPVPHRSLATPNVEVMGILTALPVLHRSLATPNVENMGILTAVPVPHSSLATPNVEEGLARRESLQLFPSSDACSSAEMTKRRRSNIRTMSAITMLKRLLATQPARHESTELQLFPPSDACTSTEITGLQRSATRTMPAIANLQSSMVTPVVKPAISDQKPSKVKGSQRKKIKDNSQKPISLS